MVRPLVIYTDDAGGENAALNADGSMLFVPSQYMQDGLLIGHSQKIRPSAMVNLCNRTNFT